MHAYMRWASNGARHVQSGLFLLVELQSGAPYAPEQLFQLRLPQVRLRYFATCPVDPELLHRVAWRLSATPTYFFCLHETNLLRDGVHLSCRVYSRIHPSALSSQPADLTTAFSQSQRSWKYNLILVWQHGLTKPTGLKSQQKRSKTEKT